MPIGPLVRLSSIGQERGKMNFNMIVCGQLLGVLTLMLSLATSASAQNARGQRDFTIRRNCTFSGTYASPDDDWHFGVKPHLWFAGLHGAVGVRVTTSVCTLRSETYFRI